MSAFFTAVKKEATCLHLRHVYDAIARRKVDIVRCPGFRDMPRHVVRDHGLALAPQDAGWRESGAITGGKSKGEEGVADGDFLWPPEGENDDRRGF